MISDFLIPIHDAKTYYLSCNRQLNESERGDISTEANTFTKTIKKEQFALFSTKEAISVDTPEVISELLLDKTTLSSYIRKKTSTVDSRSHMHWVYWCTCYSSCCDNIFAMDISKTCIKTIKKKKQ